MSTYDQYVMDVQRETWDIPAVGAARFTWEYDSDRSRLLDLYQRGKDRQWDAQTRIDWDLPVDPNAAFGLSEEFIPIYGSRQWDKLNEKQRKEVGHHLSSWVFSQFVHGEQGALTVAARIVESVPDVDSKFYAATQVMDEARHVEIFSKFVRDKIGIFYPMNAEQGELFTNALSDSRWDIPYLGMQVLAEGFGLATFSLHRDTTQNPLVKQIMAYIMQDEARHVAFGRLALRDYYDQLSQAEKYEREEFVIEGCRTMRDRYRAEDLWERLGLDVGECVEFTTQSPMHQAFQNYVFSRIVPCVRDIGLWSERVRDAFTDLGVIDAAQTDLEVVMRDDEQIADRIDAESAAAKAEIAARKAQVATTIEAAEAE